MYCGLSLEKILLSAPLQKMYRRSYSTGASSGHRREPTTLHNDIAASNVTQRTNLLVLHDDTHHLALLRVLQDGNDLAVTTTHIRHMAASATGVRTVGKGGVLLPETAAPRPCTG